MVEIIELSIEMKDYETIFHLYNLDEISLDTQNRLKKFALDRGGFFNQNISQMSVRKKWTQDIVEKAFKEFNFDFKFMQPDFENEERLLCEQRVAFGKYSGEKWKEVPTNYLQWFVSQTQENHNWYMAYAELKRRNKLSKVEAFGLDSEVSFGKFRGKRWKDLPNEYLLWLVNNFDETDSRYILAKATLLYKS